MQETNTKGKSQLKQKQQFLTNKIIFINEHINVYREKVKSEPHLAYIWEEAIHRLETEIEEFKAEITDIYYRLKKDYSNYNIHQITMLVST